MLFYAHRDHKKLWTIRDGEPRMMMMCGLMSSDVGLWEPRTATSTYIHAAPEL